MAAIPLAVVACLVAPNLAQVPDRVGRITIEGNTDTPDYVILGQLDLRPGQLLDLPSLKLTQQRLAKSGLFAADAPPAVEVVANELDSTFKDIHIRVKERRGTWAFFAAVEGMIAVAKLNLEGLGGVVLTAQSRLREE